MTFRITYDPAKRARTFDERGVDFERSGEVFAGPHFSGPDDRRDYGEERVITVGYLDGRLMIVVWTERGDARHVISMRKANAREQADARKRMD